MALTVARESFAAPRALTRRGLGPLGWFALANLIVLALSSKGLALVALGAALVVPLALALAARPQRGLLFMAAAAPFEGLLLLFPQLGILYFWKFVLVIATLGATFISRDARAPEGRPRPSWLPAAAALIFLCLVSALLIGGYQAATGFRLNFFYCLVGWAAWRCPLNQRELDRLVTILMVAGVLAGLWAMAQQFLGGEALHQLGYPYALSIRYSGSFLRSVGTFETPFGLGFFEMLVLIIAVPQVLSDPNRTRNKVFLFAIPICVLGLALSVVRGGYLGVAVALAFLGWRRYRALLLTIPLAFVVVLLLPSEFTDAALSSSSSAQRVDSWSTTLPQVVDHPFGLGVGATGSAAEKAAAQRQEGSAFVSVRTVEVKADTYQPDNYFLKTVLELGIIGLWLFVLLLVGMFKWLSAGWERAPAEDKPFLASAAALVVAAGTASIVATFFEIYPMDLFFWMVVGQATATIAGAQRS